MKKNADYYYLKMNTHYVNIPYYNEERRVRVLLPKDYDKEESSYPVIYMHDGQNVFYSKEAYAGYSWKIIPTIKNYKNIPKVIIVGIDNSGSKRLDEYSPWKTDSLKETEFSNSGGDGEKYAKWLVENLKPFIDSSYRTKKESKYNILAGSSMGAIITAYISALYPNVFGNIGIFSLSSWFSEKEFLNFISNNCLEKNTKVYIQVGTKEGDNIDKSFIDNINQAYIDSSLNYYNALIKNNHNINNIWLRIMANETHNEKYWALHFPEFLKFVFDELK